MELTTLPGAPCGWCRSPYGTALYRAEDYLTGHHFSIVQCSGCELVRTVVPETTDRIDGYGAEYYGVRGRRFHGVIEGGIRWFRRRRIRTIQRHERGPGRILDVGSGRGLMLAFLRTSGWECFGTERSGELAEATTREHCVDVRHVRFLTEAHFARHTFDVVTMWHSFEHFGDPAPTLREIRALLKPGAIVVLEVPNLDSWQARLGRERWFHLDAPRHLYHFSSATLRRILDSAGFDVVEQKTFSLEYGPYGMLQTLLNRLTSRPNTLYLLLKRQRRLPPRVGDVLITVAALPLAIVAGALLEGVSALMDRGGVTRMVARARPIQSAETDHQRS